MRTVSSRNSRDLCHNVSTPTAFLPVRNGGLDTSTETNPLRCLHVAPVSRVGELDDGGVPITSRVPLKKSRPDL